ncbi:hypothetical protein D3C72_1977440 [compost metagenome]
MLHGRHHVAVQVEHHPERTRQRDHHQHQREHQRQHVPAALRPRVHVQEVDHVHHDLHGPDQQDNDGGGGRLVEHLSHHQPERDRGQEDRQHEARQVAAQRGMRPHVLVMPVAVSVAVQRFVVRAHGNAPIR